MKSIVLPLVAACSLLLGACQSGSSSSQDPAPQAEPATAVPGDASDTAPYSVIAEDEALRFLGTEPFWGGEVGGGMLTYETPDDQAGTTIPVERFAGRGGVSFSGTLDGAKLEMMVTALECSDGMSDRTYPFTVTLTIGDDLRHGCAWSERHPFEGDEHP